MSADDTATQPCGEGSVLRSNGAVWDLLVIGGGSAGLVGARTAATLGASVLLVELVSLGWATSLGPVSSPRSATTALASLTLDR